MRSTLTFLLASAAMAGPAMAEPVFLVCRGWDYGLEGNIQFTVELDTSREGAISWVSGQRYSTYCDRENCTLSRPVGQPNNPDEQYSISRIDGVYHHLVIGEERMRSAARFEGQGCRVSDQKF